MENVEKKKTDRIRIYAFKGKIDFVEAYPGSRDIFEGFKEITSLFSKLLKEVSLSNPHKLQDLLEDHEKGIKLLKCMP